MGAAFTPGAPDPEAQTVHTGRPLVLSILHSFWQEDGERKPRHKQAWEGPAPGCWRGAGPLPVLLPVEGQTVDDHWGLFLLAKLHLEEGMPFFVGPPREATVATGPPRKDTFIILLSQKGCCLCCFLLVLMEKVPFAIAPPRGGAFSCLAQRCLMVVGDLGCRIPVVQSLCEGSLVVGWRAADLLAPESSGEPWLSTLDD